MVFWNIVFFFDIVIVIVVVVVVIFVVFLLLLRSALRIFSFLLLLILLAGALNELLQLFRPVGLYLVELHLLLLSSSPLPPSCQFSNLQPKHLFKVKWYNLAFTFSQILPIASLTTSSKESPSSASSHLSLSVKSDLLIMKIGGGRPAGPS